MQYIIISFLICITSFYAGRWHFANYTLDQRASNLGFMQCCDEDGTMGYKELKLQYKDGSSIRLKWIMRYLKYGSMSDKYER